MTEDWKLFGEAPEGTVCKPRTAGYAVITDDDGRLAAVQSTVRGRTAFWLPGGGREGEETPEENVLREIREELGFNATLQKKLGQAIQVFDAGDKGGWYRMHCVFFRAQLVGEPVNPPEHDVFWLTDPQPSAFFHASHFWAYQQWNLDLKSMRR